MGYKLLTFFLLCISCSSVWALTCNDVNGSYVYSSDGTYLGFFGSRFAIDSINNSFGTYGNQFNSNSMLNNFGTYGGQFGSKSVSNSFASINNVPVLYKYGDAIAYVTANTYISEGVTLGALLACGSTALSAALSNNNSYTPPVPDSLTGLTASDGLVDQILLTWNAATGATSYNISVSSSYSGAKELISTTTGTRVTITGASSGVTYWYWVQPVNDTGTGTGQWEIGYAAAAPVVVTPDPTPSNSAPSVTIFGGSQTIPDTDDVAGELFSFTATAADSDGTIATTQWLVDGVEVATGLNATLSLPNGLTVVTFKATDDDGTSSTTTATITVEASNISPVATIFGGSQTIPDTDNVAGELFSFTATATDSDGTIATTQWLVDGVEVATGLNATLSLANGLTVVTFKATDDDGTSSTTTATITVASPIYEPTEEWPSPYNGVTPDSSFGLAFNNIGVLNASDAKIYVCLRIFTDGSPSSVNGISQFDMGLEVVSLSEVTVRITKFREFNAIGALNEDGQTPDCSGIFETTTGVYTDIIQTDTSVLETTWSLIDPTNLILKLDIFKVLTAK